tara:strand:+ start:265 stop:1020 length:756 start_codon:yes stop_codon:yes gene_type:complete
LDNIDSFVRLICGSDFDASKEIDKILLHLQTSLKTVTHELIELQSGSDGRLGLYGPYLGRSILELSMTAIIARMDPFKILLMKGKQEQPGYDLGKPHSSAIRWQGDVVDKNVADLWADSSLKNPTRSIFGAYQVHLSLKKSVELVIDEGDENSMGEWYLRLSSTPPEGTIGSIKSLLNNSYSSLSKGIHHELLVPPESILDRDTVISILNETLYVAASTGLLVSLIPHAYKPAIKEQSFDYYKNSKELELC